MTGCASNGIRDEPNKFNFREFMNKSNCDITSSDEVIQDVAAIINSYANDCNFDSYEDFIECKNAVMQEANKLVEKGCKSLEFYNSDDGCVVLRVNMFNNSYQDFKLTSDFGTAVDIIEPIYRDHVISNPADITVPSAVDWTSVCICDTPPKEISETVNNYLNRLTYIYESYATEDKHQMKYFMKTFDRWKRQTNTFSRYGVKSVIMVTHSSKSLKCTLRFQEQKVVINVERNSIRVSFVENM